MNFCAKATKLFSLQIMMIPKNNVGFPLLIHVITTTNKARLKTVQHGIVQMPNTRVSLHSSLKLEHKRIVGNAK